MIPVATLSMDIYFGVLKQSDFFVCRGLSNLYHYLYQGSTKKDFLLHLLFILSMASPFVSSSQTLLLFFYYSYFFFFFPKFLFLKCYLSCFSFPLIQPSQGNMKFVALLVIQIKTQTQTLLLNYISTSSSMILMNFLQVILVWNHFLKLF